MKLEVLLSTMYMSNDNLIDKMNIKTNCTIVNQCENDSIYKKNYNGHLLNIINSKERGLSKSRNMALNNSTGDILLLADDDMVYVDDYEKIILNTFKKYNEDIIAFQVEGIEKKFKTYKPKSCRVNKLTSMKISSVEVAIRKSSLKNKNLQFNELFGSGSIYKMGEENIFLFNCLDNGLKIRYVPIKIADLHMADSTWFTGFNEKYFFDRGATYYEMFGILCDFLILQFIFRKRKVLEISMYQAWKCALKGKLDYIERKRR